MRTIYHFTIADFCSDLYPVQRILQMVVFGVLLVLYFVGIALRWISAEVFAFAFHLFHIVSHIVLLMSLIFQFDPSVFVFIYALLLLLGKSPFYHNFLIPHR